MNAIDFSKVEIIKDEEQFPTYNKRKEFLYVIGCDPTDNINKTGDLSVFSVYDKGSMKITTRVKTTLKFEEFVTWYMNGETIKGLYEVSDKFINKETGKPLTIDEIRNRI